MHRGYVKLWRRILDNGMLSDGPLCQVFLKGILDTAHSTTTRRVCGQDIPLQPGEFVYGRKAWAHDLKVTEKVLRRRIQDLLEAEIIEHSPCENPGPDEGTKRASTRAQERASKKASTYTVFRFVNWSVYQGSVDLEGQQKGQQKGQHLGETRAQKGPHLKNGEHEENKNLESPDGDSSGSASAAPSAHTQKRPPCPYSEILALYHELLPQLPTVQSFDDSAKKTMRARWNESTERQDLKFWRRVFITVAASDFLMGRVKDWQCPGLLWIIGPKNFAKIVNGHYSNHGPRTGSSLTDNNLRVTQEWAAEGGAPQ